MKTKRSASTNIQLKKNKSTKTKDIKKSNKPDPKSKTSLTEKKLVTKKKEICKRLIECIDNKKKGVQDSIKLFFPIKDELPLYQIYANTFFQKKSCKLLEYYLDAENEVTHDSPFTEDDVKEMFYHACRDYIRFLKTLQDEYHLPLIGIDLSDRSALLESLVFSIEQAFEKKAKVMVETPKESETEPIVMEEKSPEEIEKEISFSESPAGKVFMLGKNVLKDQLHMEDNSLAEKVARHSFNLYKKVANKFPNKGYILGFSIAVGGLVCWVVAASIPETLSTALQYIIPISSFAGVMLLGLIVDVIWQKIQDKKKQNKTIELNSVAVPV